MQSLSLIRSETTQRAWSGRETRRATSWGRRVQYRQEHGIAQDADKGKATAEASVPHDRWRKYTVKRLSSKDCAAKVRTFYPRAYDDLDDATLAKKVLAKYPTYCE